MKLIIGSDHGAVDLKEEVKRVLKEEFAEVEVEDVGTFGTESVDYPDVAEKVCTPVANGEADRGIVLCGTGIGISIAANKIKGIRAALCHETYTAKCLVNIIMLMFWQWADVQLVLKLQMKSCVHG